MPKLPPAHAHTYRQMEYAPTVATRTQFFYLWANKPLSRYEMPKLKKS